MTTGVPTQMGRYLLERKLGSGGMAEVFLATQLGPTGFRRRCVVKRAHKHLTEDADFVKMFLDEARLAAQLDHPNIVQVLDFGEHEGSYFFAMEYVPGLDLREILRGRFPRQEQIPLPVVVRIISLVAQALDFAHHAKSSDGVPLELVHRDVSPHNILISTSGMVKLIDFGIAKAATARRKTESGMVKGKVTYMSPEQLHGKVLDGRSDLFALGLVFYELIAGQPAIPRGPEPEMIRVILEQRFEPIEHFRPQLPKELKTVLDRALQRLPDDRYARGQALSLELEKYLVSLGALLTSDDLAALIPKESGAGDGRGGREASQGLREHKALDPHAVPTLDMAMATRTQPPSPSEAPTLRGDTPVARSPAAPTEPESPGAVPPTLLDAPVPPSSPPRPTATPPAPSQKEIPAVAAAQPARPVARPFRRAVYVAAALVAVTGGIAAGAWLWSGPSKPGQAPEPLPTKLLPEVAVPAPTRPPPSVANAPTPELTPPHATPTKNGSKGHHHVPSHEGQPEPAVAKLTVRAEVPARVTIDGQSRGLAPIFVTLEPGKHAMRFVSDALGIAKDQDVDVGPGEEREETWHVGRGVLEFWVLPEGSEVFLDGKSLGAAPLQPTQAWEGKHSLRFVSSETGHTEKQDVQITAGTKQTVKVNLSSAPPGK